MTNQQGLKVWQSEHQGSGCTGHCCRAFRIGGRSPEDLRLEYEAWLRGLESGDVSMDRTGGGQRRKRWDNELSVRHDIHLVFPMLIYLGRLRTNPLPLVDEQPELPDDHPGDHFYTCKHLEESGRCSVYEIRPMMCRAYGLGRDCEFKDCTWEGHRAELRLKKLDDQDDGLLLAEKIVEVDDVRAANKAD